MATPVSDLVIMTLNVRGMKGDKVRDWKIVRIKHLIKLHSPDFIFLQETHFDSDFLANQITIDNLNLATGRHSLTDDNTTGTTILVTSDRWQILGSTVDNNTGRVVTVDIVRNHTYYTLTNIYAPSRSTNHDRTEFFTDCQSD